MSLILDAINKSEQKRPQVETVPSVGTMHDAGAAAKPSPWRRMLWPVITTVLALLVLVLWLDPDSRTAAPVEEAASLPEQVAAPVLPEPVLPEPASLSATPAPEPIVRKVASSPASPAAEPSPGVGATDVASLYAPALAVDGDVSAPVDSAAVEIEVVEVELGETAAVAPEPAPLDVETIALAAQKALEEQVAEPDDVVMVHAVPLISDLRQRTKDEIPSIFFSSHHWSTVASERVVTLNGQARREGAQIKPGLKLLEILEDSIVLDYRGTEFRLRALNSWVNL
jgi:hypothetical protein